MVNQLNVCPVTLCVPDICGNASCERLCVCLRGSVMPCINMQSIMGDVTLYVYCTDMSAYFIWLARSGLDHDLICFWG